MARTRSVWANLQSGASRLAKRWTPKLAAFSRLYGILLGRRWLQTAPRPGFLFISFSDHSFNLNQTERAGRGAEAPSSSDRSVLVARQWNSWRSDSGIDTDDDGIEVFRLQQRDIALLGKLQAGDERTRPRRPQTQSGWGLTRLLTGSRQQLIEAERRSAVRQLGSVTAMMAFGAFLGALWGGYFTDKVGRLRMFLLDLLFLVVAAIGAAASVNLVMLLAFRFLMGVGGDLWRVAVGFGAVPALIILLMRLRYMNESAPWAAHHRGLAEAGRILERTYGVRVTVAPLTAPIAPAKASKIDFSEIFSRQFRLRTLLVSIICMTQSIEYFAVGFNLPTISTRLFGANFIYAILGAILFNLFGIAGAAVAITVTNRLGIRRIAIFGYASSLSHSCCCMPVDPICL